MRSLTYTECSEIMQDSLVLDFYYELPTSVQGMCVDIYNNEIVMKVFIIEGSGEELQEQIPKTIQLSDGRVLTVILEARPRAYAL